MPKPKTNASTDLCRRFELSRKEMSQTWILWCFIITKSLSYPIGKTSYVRKRSIMQLRRISYVLLLSILVSLHCFQGVIVAQKNVSASKFYKFINGQWFDGKNFQSQTFYSVDGILTRKKPRGDIETIDLSGGFVVPPFADAHCHHFAGANNIALQVKMYLQNGVFYAKVQADVRSGAMQVADKVNNPGSVDVSYAHGALTHTYGHGIQVYEALALGVFDPKIYEANIARIAASHVRENDAYYIIDTVEDLENKWQKILDGKPDFIKVYLLTSEDYEEKSRNIDKIRLGSIGLDPKLVPVIVRKAHSAGLRVSAHVDTATDFRIALKAGVDEMAHLPGYFVRLEDKAEKYLLTDEDAKEAARRKLWVIPAPIATSGHVNIQEKRDNILKQNLSLLKKYRVPIAFGSDRFGSTPLEDVLYLNKLGTFNNLEMLKIWSEETPRTIFPNRKLGKFKDGYEASFIVLEKSPLENFENVKTISFRFKQGTILSP